MGEIGCKQLKADGVHRGKTESGPMMSHPEDVSTVFNIIQ